MHPDMSYLDLGCCTIICLSLCIGDFRTFGAHTACESRRMSTVMLLASWDVSRYHVQSTVVDWRSCFVDASCNREFGFSLKQKPGAQHASASKKKASIKSCALQHYMMQACPCSCNNASMSMHTQQQLNNPHVTTTKAFELC